MSTCAELQIDLLAGRVVLAAVPAGPAEVPPRACDARMWPVPAHAKEEDGEAVDGSLVARCLDGEVAAERELFHREFPKVKATLYRILGPNSEIEDLVQETFLEVARSLRSFRGEACLSTWINRLTVRVAIGYFKRKRPPMVALDLVPEHASTSEAPDRAIVAREGVRRLYKALERLSACNRVAFALHVIEGKKLSEVAQLTGASLIATKIRVHRARRHMELAAAADPILSLFLASDAKSAEP